MGKRSRDAVDLYVSVFEEVGHREIHEDESSVVVRFLVSPVEAARLAQTLLDSAMSTVTVDDRGDRLAEFGTGPVEVEFPAIASLSVCPEADEWGERILQRAMRLLQEELSQAPEGETEDEFMKRVFR